jgi:hypothetical protein
MGLTCPSCGGRVVRPVGGGWFQCVGALVVARYPGQDNVPHPHVLPVACAHRFYVGAGQGAITCERGGCGLDSIGACPKCGKRLCYQHYGTPCDLCQQDAEFDADKRRKLARADEQTRLESASNAREVGDILRAPRIAGDPISPRHVLDAWLRLAKAEMTPATNLYLARVRCRRKSLISRSWQAEPETRLGPVWMAARALSIEVRGDDTSWIRKDAVLGRDGIVHLAAGPDSLREDARPPGTLAVFRGSSCITRATQYDQARLMESRRYLGGPLQAADIIEVVAGALGR